MKNIIVMIAFALCLPELFAQDFETVEIPAGDFIMGSPKGEKRRWKSEEQHKVIISKPFKITKTEITNQQFANFLNKIKVKDDGKLPASHKVKDYEKWASPVLIEYSEWGVEWNFRAKKWQPIGDLAEHPVVGVTWYGAMAFAKFYGGNLPTEAQWEYACRAGSPNSFCFFSENPDSLTHFGWFDANAIATHQVGTRQSNAFDVFDMHGNASEWCRDAYKANYGLASYSAISTDPFIDGKSTAERIVRGGSVVNPFGDCRSAARSSMPADISAATLGFRIVFEDYEK